MLCEYGAEVSAQTLLIYLNFLFVYDNTIMVRRMSTVLSAKYGRPVHILLFFVYFLLFCLYLSLKISIFI